MEVTKPEAAYRMTDKLYEQMMKDRRIGNEDKLIEYINNTYGLSHNITKVIRK